MGKELIQEIAAWLTLAFLFMCLSAVSYLSGNDSWSAWCGGAATAYFAQGVSMVIVRIVAKSVSQEAI